MPYPRSKLQRGWQAEVHTRMDRLQLLYTSRLLSDVIFYVGRERVPVEAHKLILMMYSPVFEKTFSSSAEICSHKSKKMEIEVPDVKSSTFDTMMQFMYLGSLQVDYSDIDSLMNLLLAATKYEIPDLESQMKLVVISQVKVGNVLSIFHLAHMMNIKELVDYTFDYICRYATEILTASNAFKSMSPQQLEILMGSDKLNINELDLFKYALKWATEACKIVNTCPTPVAVRSMLSKIVPQIRFVLMTPTEIAENVAPLKILSSDQLVRIYNKCSRKSRSYDKNESAPRGPMNNNLYLKSSTRSRYAVLKRFTSKTPLNHHNSQGRWSNEKPSWQCVSFTVDKAIRILGVSIFGLSFVPAGEMCNPNVSNFAYEVRLMEGRTCSKVLASEKDAPDPCKIGETVYVPFGSGGTRLHPGSLYTLAATVKTVGISYIGNGGNPVIKVPWFYETVKFCFQETPEFSVEIISQDPRIRKVSIPNSNSSTEFIGEFPEIFFTLA